MEEMNELKAKHHKTFKDVLLAPLRFFMGKSTARQFFRNYIAIVLIGGILLSLPIAHSDLAREMGTTGG
jgi:uncharacterized membrane protein